MKKYRIFAWVVLTFWEWNLSFDFHLFPTFFLKIKISFIEIMIGFEYSYSLSKWYYNKNKTSFSKGFRK